MTYLYEHPRDLDELASFLEQLNKTAAHHIGYCGEEKQEIYDTLKELNAQSTFICAYEGSQLIGAIGLDIYDSLEEAEVWGPFINREDRSWEQIAETLFEKLTSIPKLQFFINIKNIRAVQWLKTKQAISKGNYAILKSARDQVTLESADPVVSFASADTVSFSTLHNSTFPNTYYSAADIIKNINSQCQLLMIKDSISLIGYVYLEADPMHSEGSIEYIAISPDYQKQGYGTILIVAALQRLFSFPSINEITLCVNEDNPAAIRLYRAAGFQLEHVLEGYEWLQN